MNDWPKRYSQLLHESARRWGLVVPEDPPIIDDATSPYPRPVVVETLRWQGKQVWTWAEIEIVTLNGFWSYTLSFTVPKGGEHYGACLKFCDPLPTRGAAIEAAVARMFRRHSDILPDELMSWLRKIRQPVQLDLFASGGDNGKVQA